VLILSLATEEEQKVPSILERKTHNIIGSSHEVQWQAVSVSFWHLYAIFARRRNAGRVARISSRVEEGKC
jgi:hypothetical protein